jgi:hypothetical protein
MKDKQFLKQMNSEFKRDSTGSWVAPLPFRSPRQSLPNNREQAVQRAVTAIISLRKRRSTPRRLFDKSGPVSRTLFSDIPLNFATGSWVAPLPFRSPRQSLPNNREQAVQRAKYLDSSLRRNPKKREHMVEFMQKILANNHAEVAPPLQNNEECWYLPLFGVYHPKKPDQIRGVFDSFAKFKFLLRLESKYFAR